MKEVLKLLSIGIIYPIPDSKWVSPIHMVPKKSGIQVVENANNELVPTRLVTGWRMCIDYRKLNEATRKDHFHFLSSTKCSRDWPTRSTFPSLMGIAVISKYLSTPMIKRRQPSLAPLALMHTGACHSDYAMHPEPFNGA